MNETPGAGGAAGKRPGEIAARRRPDKASATMPAPLASLGGGFYAVAQVGPGRRRRARRGVDTSTVRPLGTRRTPGPAAGGGV